MSENRECETERRDMLGLAGGLIVHAMCGVTQGVGWGVEWGVGRGCGLPRREEWRLGWAGLLLEL